MACDDAMRKFNLDVEQDSIRARGNPGYRLLQYFARLPGTALREQKSVLRGESYFLFQASESGLFGTGRGNTRFEACLKAVAECLERKFVSEAFSGKLAYIPQWLRTSNGFAVHTDLERSRQAAVTEAMERHILQFTYFKEGWSGFEVLEQIRDGNRNFIRIVSRYRCNGYRAGMILAMGAEFAGISVGYLADKEENFRGSTRWKHAYHEAIDKIEPMLRLAESNERLIATPLHRDIFRWLNEPKPAFQFGRQLKVIELPEVLCDIQSFDLMSSWKLNFPFYGSFATGPDMMPLIVLSKILVEDEESVKKILDIHGLPQKIPLGNPVL